MLHIDGSYGEGGGQILRTAISLSVLTHTPIRVDHIRSNRSNPGLRPQHHLALSVMKQLSNAETSGLSIGSKSITFEPKRIQPGSYEFDIGTAGSMTLVFQTLLLGLLHTDQQVQVKLCGGSDVKWAPSWDFFSEVFLPVVKQMGVSVSARILRRGFYPKGGGSAEITIDPMKSELKPFVFDSFYPSHVYGRVLLGNLPDHIAKRMKHTAMKKAIQKDITVNIQTETVESDSPGVGLTLWSRGETGVFGAYVPGEKGVPAERIGNQAIDAMIADIQSTATVDLYLSDQLVPYMALADGTSEFFVRKMTGHCQTNLWVLNQFFDDVDVVVEENKDDVKIMCMRK